MTYILVLAITYASGSMVFIPTEYNTLQKCEAAGKSFQMQLAGNGVNPKFACIPSGNNP